MWIGTEPADAITGCSSALSVVLEVPLNQSFGMGAIWGEKNQIIVVGILATWVRLSNS